MPPTSFPYRWLVSGLLVWLLSAWSVQEPAKKAAPVSERTAATPTDSTKLKAVKHDPATGLALDKGLPLVVGNCTACHSSKLILNSHFSRDKWVERIRWMQKTQKLWDLGPSELAILTYLTTYYGPIDAPFDGRRLPLPAPVWHSR